MDQTKGYRRPYRGRFGLSGHIKIVPQVIELFGAMIVWKIVPGREPEFIQHWTKKSVIKDKSGLVSEVLFEPISAEAFGFKVDDLSSPHDSYTSFINIAFWRGYEDFEEEVSKYFTEDKLDFEWELRRRTMLRPQEVRLGDWPLPDATCE